jgi:hypothetical protein
MTTRRRFDIGWLIVVLLSIFAIAPLTAPGFFLKAHDATIGSYFLMEFDKGIAGGALYPRWAIDWTYGYGYPLFVVIAPLAFYVAEAFHLLGAGITDALKLTYALAFILSGLSMYLLGRELFGRAGGILAAALYVYAPYHLVDIYVRADVAEFASFAFFPAILWAILRLSRATSRAESMRYIALGGLLYGGLILTHITMALVFTPVAILYALRVSPSRPLALSPSRPLALFALGLAISAAYLIPAFLEQRYLRAADLVGGYFGYANHYVYPFQLLSPFWGYGYAAIGPNDQMPYQLGALVVVLAGFSLWALPRLESALRRQVIFFLAMTGLLVFAMLAASQPLWDLLRPIVAFVQFPWRLLSLTSLTLALAGGALGAGLLDRAAVAGHAERSEASQPPASAAGETLRRGPDSGPYPAGAQSDSAVAGAGVAWQGAAPLLILLALLASYNYTAPQYTDGDVTLAKMIQFQLDTKELLGDTIWVTEKPSGSAMVAQYLAGQPPLRAIPDDSQASIEVLASGGQSYEVRVTTPAGTAVLFQIRYFPGWRAYVDGRPVATAIRAPQGLIAVAVAAGQHRILLRFEDSPLRRASKVVTLLGLLVAVALLIWSRRRIERG